MKKLFLFVSIMISLPVFSQGVARVFNEKSMTFYGLDFTESKCVGMAEFPGGEEMVDFYIPIWNDLFMRGKKRIRIGSVYKKKHISYDTSVYQYNRSIVKNDLVVNTNHILKRSKMEDYVHKYMDKDKEGLGLVYIVESLNAVEEYASIWICFFDISTGKVLIAEPCRGVGKARDFGLKWEDAIFDTYINSAEDFKTWKKLYN